MLIPSDKPNRMLYTSAFGFYPAGPLPVLSIAREDVLFLRRLLDSGPVRVTLDVLGERPEALLEVEQRVRQRPTPACVWRPGLPFAYPYRGLTGSTIHGEHVFQCPYRPDWHDT